MIRKSEKIYINGSDTAFGGTVYSASFDMAYGPSPSKLSISILSKSGKYLSPQLSAIKKHTITIGNLSLKMHLIMSTLEDGVNGRLLRLDFVDGRIALNRYWVVTPDFPYSQSNIIKVGALFSGSLTGAYTPDNTEPFWSYDYSMLCSASPFPLPPFAAQTNFARLSTQGTLGSIFSEFCRIYGYTWYWDPVEDKCVVINLNSDTRLDKGLLEEIKTNSLFKTVSYSETLEGLSTSANIAFSNLKSENELVGTNLISVISFMDIGSLFGRDRVDDADIEAGIFASYGDETYANYIFSKYSIEEAVQIMGYEFKERITGSALTDVINALSTENNLQDFSGNLNVYRVRVEKETSQKRQIHLAIAEAIRSKYLGYFISPFSLQSTGAFEITRIDSAKKISEIPGLAAFLKGSGGGSLAIEESTDTIADHMTMNLYLVKSNELDIEFTGVKSKDEKGNPLLAFKQRRLITNLTQAMEQISQFTADDIFLATWWDWAETGVSIGARITRGVAYVVAKSDYTTYGKLQNASKYNNSLFYIPPIGEYSLEYNVNETQNTFGNLSAVNLEAMSVIPVGPLQTITAQFYGLTTNVPLTPQNGLESIRISMGDNGYESTYTLSSRQRIPLNPMILPRQL